MSDPHLTVPVQVWVDIDRDIAPLVIKLNEIPGIRTHASCQGTVGEGGAEPYGPYVMVTWDDEDALHRLLTGEWSVVGMEGNANMGYVHPL